MASINLPVNIKKLLADQQAALIANTDAKAVETQAHVDAKITETKSHVTTKATDTKTSVNTNTDSEMLEVDNAVAAVATGVDALPAHITSESDRVLANIPESKGASFQTEGIVSDFFPAGSTGNLYIAPEVAGKVYRIVLLVTNTTRYQTGMSLTTNTGEVTNGFITNKTASSGGTSGVFPRGSIGSSSYLESVLEVIECKSFSLDKVTGGGTSEGITLAFEIGSYQ